MQSKLKICMTDFLQTTKMWIDKTLKSFLRLCFNFGSKRNLPLPIHCENFTMGCTVGFRVILDQRVALTALDSRSRPRSSAFRLG